MNLRKFFLITSVIVSGFLFFMGLAAIYLINSDYLNSDMPVTAQSGISRIFSPFKQDKIPFNILVLGLDKVNDNSDTMMLVNFDPTTCRINIMSIPRDTKVMIDDNYRKINFAFTHGGIDLSVKTVSELLDIKIKFYIFVNTSVFRDIIDLLGGVNIDIYADMNYDDPTQNLHIHLQKGLQKHLNGDKSEQFIRFREPNYWTTPDGKEIKKYYDGSDLKRIVAQQRFLKELINQKANVQYFPKLNNIINTVFDNIGTNYSLNEVIRLMAYISKFNTDNLNFIPLPGKPTDAAPWYYICDTADARTIASQYFNYYSNFTNVENNPSNSDSSLKGSTKPEP